MEKKHIQTAIATAVICMLVFVIATTLILQIVCLTQIRNELGAGTRIEATATQTINIYYNATAYQPKWAEISNGIVRWENGSREMIASLDQVVIFIGEIR